MDHAQLKFTLAIDFFPANKFFLRNTWSGSNKYARDGKGPGFESDRICFSYQTEKIPFTKKVSSYYLSAYFS